MGGLCSKKRFASAKAYDTSDGDTPYSPLDPSHASVRVLVLLPGKFDDAVRCELRAKNLDDRPNYEALSYLWGQASRNLTVMLAGQSVVVTDNLHSALRHIRYPNKDRLLWVDALCINQADDEEKMRQVGMMGRIFRESVGCLIWLGPISAENDKPYTFQDAEMAFEMIHFIAAANPQANLPATLASSAARRGAVSALNGMMLWGNGWWRRIWTVQEAVLPREKTILWDTLSISWDTCVQASREIMDRSKHPPVALLCTELFSININDFITPFLSLGLTQKEARTRPLFTAYRWRYREATDPRDKVYGLMGLFDHAHLPSITCDYGMHPSAVFAKFTLDLLRLEGDLMPLVGWRGEGHATPGLPTWALDMVRPTQLANWGCKFWEHIDRYARFSADNHAALSLETLRDDSVLSLRGVLIDTVALVDEGIAVDERVVLPHGDFIRMVQRRQRILAEFIKNSAGELVLDGSGKDAFWRTMLGDAVTDAERVKRRATARDEELFDAFLDNGQPNEVVESLRSMIVNQAFFITERGYLGIGPPGTEKGDAVWILLGGRVPFVLRPLKSESRQEGVSQEYSFLGDAYVHGVMDGELFEKGQEDVKQVFVS